MSSIEAATTSANSTGFHNHDKDLSSGQQVRDATEAEVSFLKYDSRYEHEKLYTMNYVTESMVPRTNAKNERRTVPVQNFRVMQNPPSFDECGFATTKLQSSLRMSDFDDSAKVEDVFYGEVKALLGKMFPAACAIEVLEHQIRKRPAGFPYHTGEPYKDLLPTTLVHVDFTPESAAKSGNAAFRGLADRYPNLLAVNLWKSLQGPGNDWPLALCDARTVDYTNDLASQDLVFADRYNENLRVYYNENQEWFYYPDLKEDEIVVFRQADSRISLGGGVPHTGFLNPQADKNSKPRVSIEIRAFIYFT